MSTQEADMIQEGVRVAIVIYEKNILYCQRGLETPLFYYHNLH